MSKPFNDPSLLTKDRLKKELERNGVKLPRGEQKKQVYVKLYQENLSPRSDRRLGNGEFSSDDDYDDSDKQIVPKTSLTISKVGSKEIISQEIKSMTNEELKEELSDLGQPIGPILPSTRGLYERKLANLYATSQNNTGTIVTVTNSEFSDNDFGEEQEPEEESIPNDEFFHGDQNRRGDNFGSNFSKNFENSSSKKEVTRDFSVSSSRNVERSSTFDRKTINKVRSKKGDKFEEKSWSSTSDNQNDENDDGVDMNSLPPSIQILQKAITAARRLTPEKENGTGGLRERSSWQPKPEVVPKTETEKNVDEKPTTQDEKKKSQTSLRRWWILLVVLIVLIALVAAVAYNFEHLPNIKQYLDAQESPQPSMSAQSK